LKLEKGNVMLFAYRTLRRPLRAALSSTAFALLALSVAPAQAQYQWRDNNGQMIISDQPPPANIKPSQIIKSAPLPAPAPAAPKPAAKDGKDAKPTVAKGPLTSAEKEADFQKRRKEQADAQKTSSEKQAAAEQKAKHCESLQEKMRTLSSGMRINSVQKSGEVVAMEAADREKEMSKTSREISSSQCSS
jgi:type IV secretory pathway VirB10-like protein